MNLKDLVRYCSISIPGIEFPDLSVLVEAVSRICMSIVNPDIQKTLIITIMQTRPGREALATAMINNEKLELYDIYFCDKCKIPHQKDEENPCENEIIRQIHEI